MTGSEYGDGPEAAKFPDVSKEMGFAADLERAAVALREIAEERVTSPHPLETIVMALRLKAEYYRREFGGAAGGGPVLPDPDEYKRRADVFNSAHQSIRQKAVREDIRSVRKKLEEEIARLSNLERLYRTAEGTARSAKRFCELAGEEVPEDPFSVEGVMRRTYVKAALSACNEAADAATAAELAVE